MELANECFECGDVASRAGVGGKAREKDAVAEKGATVIVRQCLALGKGEQAIFRKMPGQKR